MTRLNKASDVFFIVQNNEIQTLRLFDVKWVETAYWKEDYEIGSHVFYRITLDSGEVLIVRTEDFRLTDDSIDQSKITVHHTDQARAAISAIGHICRSKTRGEALSGPYNWPYARWIKEKLGDEIAVPWHSQDEIL